MDANNLPDFSGKLVLFYTANAPRAIQDGVLMEFISYKAYEGRLFLTGRIPTLDENGTDWVSNLQAAISWDEVVHYIVFDSREDYLSRTSGAKLPFLRRLFG